jgi:hypothetical protein
VCVVSGAVVGQPFDGCRQSMTGPNRCSTAVTMRSRTSSRLMPPQWAPLADSLVLVTAC